jgi:hypothetical protein
LRECLQLNYRKGLHRELSDAELVSVLEYFSKAGVLFVSKNDILARLDVDMGAQLDNKVPMLIQVESIQSRYVEGQKLEASDVIQKVFQSSPPRVACQSVTEFAGIAATIVATPGHAGAARQ